MLQVKFQCEFVSPLATRKMARVTELRSKSRLESPIGQDK